MAESNLNRLYSMLTEKTGIPRVRDVRLEKIAADRALEMRYHQGLVYNPNNPIQHEPYQIGARVYPWQPTNGATENALWHYYPPTWVDPVIGAVDHTFPNDPAVYGVMAGQSVGWWNSSIHKSQLMDTRWTHWGHGIHFEDAPSLGARRWYFITVFAAPMDPLAPKDVTMKAMQHVGYHLTAEGKVIAKQYRKIASPQSAVIDDRMQVPGFGPMVHLSSAPLKNWWIKGPNVIWQN